MVKRLQSTYPEADGFKAHKIPDDLHEESAAAIMNSMMEVVRDIAGVDIAVRREMIPCRSVNVSDFVVTLPPSLTQEQRVEIDYWLRGVCGNLSYSDERPARSLL